MATIMKLSVAEALERIEMSEEIIKAFSNRDDIWDSFGKTDSHMLRAKLFKMFRAANLDKSRILMVFILFSAMKNKNRVLQHVDNLPSEMKGASGMDDVKKFIENSLVQYVTQETSSKFAVVHLPTTMPGLDIMVNAMIYSESDANFDMLLSKQTFSQIHLNDELQSYNKEKQKNFWNNTMGFSRNESNDLKGKKAEFKEEFYNTAAKDKYLLVDFNLKEVKPRDLQAGYAKEEVIEWYKKLKSDNNKLKRKADLPVRS
jgi:hypothetical protein